MCKTDEEFGVALSLLARIVNRAGRAEPAYSPALAKCLVPLQLLHKVRGFLKGVINTEQGTDEMKQATQRVFT